MINIFKRYFVEAIKFIIKCGYSVIYQNKLESVSLGNLQN